MSEIENIEEFDEKVIELRTYLRNNLPIDDVGVVTVSFLTEVVENATLLLAVLTKTADEKDTFFIEALKRLDYISYEVSERIRSFVADAIEP